MKFRTPIAILSALLLMSFSLGKVLSGSFDPATYELKLGNIIINKNSTVAEFEKVYGQPTRKVKDNAEALNYYYEDLGVLLSTENGKIKAVGITFNSDGDSNFTQKAYTGNFKFAELNINAQTKQEDLKKTGFFVCPMPLMCASAKREVPVLVMAGFEKEGEKRITQMAFIIN